MKNLKGSNTAKNLMAAFAGESQARNRYTYFSGQAKKDGFIQIADIFTETAEQEKEHAKRLFKFMDSGEQEITAAFPFGVIGATEKNLLASAAGEKHEYSEMYPSFAKIAAQEGLGEIASVMLAIAIAEQGHEARFLALADNIRAGRVFKREKSVKWRCRNCGCIHEGLEAPAACPACAHPRDYFELLASNW
jgi:rubrerythrin